MKVLFTCFLIVIGCFNLPAQQLMWFDTLDYNLAKSISHIKAVSVNRLLMFGSNNGLYITAVDDSGEKIWYRDDIKGGGDRSNLYCDSEGNIYFAQRFFDATSSICGAPVNPGTYMICLNKNGDYKWHTPMPISPSSPNTVVTNQKGLIELRSGIGGGKVALHQYDAQGNIVHADLNEQSRLCKYDNHGNAFKIINGLYTKFDPDGHPEWIYQVGSNFDNIVVDPNGYSYLIADSYGFTCDVVCLSPQGKAKWSVSLPTANVKGDCDGSNLYLAGLYGKDSEIQGGVVYKLDTKSGQAQWKTEVPNSQYFRVMALSCAGGNIFMGAHYQNSPTYAYLLMLQDHTYQPVTTGIEMNKAVGQFGVYPNPTSDVFTLTPPENCESFSYRVMDATGRLVFHKQNCELPAGAPERIDLSGFSKGLYTLTIELSDGSRQSKKLLVK